MELQPILRSGWKRRIVTRWAQLQVELEARDKKEHRLSLGLVDTFSAPNEIDQANP
jgi:hypothetical protein